MAGSLLSTICRPFTVIYKRLHDYRYCPVDKDTLQELEVEPWLIPFTVSTAKRAEKTRVDKLGLTPEEAKDFIGILDKVVSKTKDLDQRKRCFDILCKVSRAYVILPSSSDLLGVTLSETGPGTSEKSEYIRKGQLDGHDVCVKEFRPRKDLGLRKIKPRFYHEVIMCKYPVHPNVVPFLGISEMSSSFWIITPWIPNGNILGYISEHGDANRLQLLAQVACGLEYLHSLIIVHGSVHPGNILIEEDGTARLGDFRITGLLTDIAIAEPRGIMDSKSSVVRYIAPELIKQSKLKTSKESDIYSFAMTAYHVLTGILPYEHVGEFDIHKHVLNNERPLRPEDTQWLQNQIWDMIVACWDEKRDKRWDIHSVYSLLSVSSTEGQQEGARRQNLLRLT